MTARGWIGPVPVCHTNAPHLPAVASRPRSEKVARRKS